MKNQLVCSKCQTENPFYGLICTNCKSYLRERINNLDLWEILARLVDNPISAFKKIIQSEHKNFITFILFFTSLKLFIDARFLSLTFHKGEGLWNNLLTGFLIVLFALVILVLIFSAALKYINEMMNLKTRIRDNSAILIYSFIPYIFALFILLPLELVIFGGSLFSNNPSPFVIKNTLAYTFAILEGLCVLWTAALSILAMYSQSRSIIYSIISALSFNFLTWILLYFLSFQLFY